jgi:uncharacterized protein YjbI with pentapeptide repeats
MNHWAEKQQARLAELMDLAKSDPDNYWIGYWNSDQHGYPANAGSTEVRAEPGTIHEAPGPLRSECGAGQLHATVDPIKWKGSRVWIACLIGPRNTDDDNKSWALKREIIGDILPNQALSEGLGARLGRKNLSGADLYCANLSGANLSRADLSRADLSRANLSGANLSGADLSGADLSGANLYCANLSGANLSRANLSGADLSGANLYGANLYGANLSRADLSRANLSGADLSGADLSRANLSGADLYGANLYGANLSGANLSGAIGISAYKLPYNWKIENGVIVSK